MSEPASAWRLTVGYAAVMTLLLLAFIGAHVRSPVSRIERDVRTLERRAHHLEVEATLALRSVAALRDSLDASRAMVRGCNARLQRVLEAK